MTDTIMLVAIASQLLTMAILWKTDKLLSPEPSRPHEIQLRLKNAPWVMAMYLGEKERYLHKRR